MIKSEIHKCIIKNGLWKIIIFFLLIKICSVCVQQYDYNELIESNKKNYLDILEWASGKVDGSKEEKINKFYNNLVKKVKARNELQQFQQNNRIGIDEYKKKYIELTHEIEGRDAFNLVYHQYVKARENPDKIWIIYDNGLNAFWSQTAPDHFLIMLLIIFNVLIIGSDYENEMDCILRTSYMGRKKLFFARCISSYLFSFIITALFFIIEIGYIQIKFGIDGLEAPIQSISFLENSNYNGNIIGALIGVLFLRIAGAFFLVTLVHMLTYLTKRNIISIFLSLSVIYVPYMLQTKESTIYHFPTPIGMMIAKGYYLGNKDEKDEEIIKTTFQSVGKEELWGIMLCTVILCLIFIAISFCLFMGKKIRLNKSLCLLFLICAVQFCGCNRSDGIIYNSRFDSQEYNIGDNKIVLDTDIYLLDKKNTRESLLKDPFFDKEKMNYIRGIWGNANDIYFLYNKNQIEIYKINLEDMSNEYIFKYDYSDNKQSPDEIVSWASADKFWIDGNVVYILTGTTIRSINMITNTAHVVVTDVVGDFSYDNGIFYYINSDDELIEAKSDGSDSMKTGVYANECWFEDGKVNYTDFFSGDHMILNLKMKKG